MSIGINIDFSWVSSVARTSGLAVDNNLWRQVHLGPGVVPSNVDSVSNRASGSMGPARSAVSGDMLIPAPRQIVLATDISPIPRFRKSVKVKVFVRPRRSDEFLESILGGLSPAGALFLSEL